MLEHGFYALSTAYKAAFPHLHYQSQNALELLLQMPLAGVRIGDPKSGVSSWYLLEFIEGINYTHVVQFLEATSMSRQSSVCIKKHELKALLGLAQSDRERELVRYTAFKSSGLSTTGARKHLGLESIILHCFFQKLYSLLQDVCNPVLVLFCFYMIFFTVLARTAAVHRIHKFVGCA